jgi:hypothetical protein
MITFRCELATDLRKQSLPGLHMHPRQQVWHAPLRPNPHLHLKVAAGELGVATFQSSCLQTALSCQLESGGKQLGVSRSPYLLELPTDHRLILPEARAVRVGVA